ncbi:MAG: ATP-binding cassette domain-containing protein [Chthoniobacterales bacterium]|nr:ATP-binding cassette domain-containing protein [Chthoniobacterales bacterium]
MNLISPSSTTSLSQSSERSLSLQRVSIHLGGREIIHDVSAEINKGEFIGILGPNGAGKSTLMKAILGLCPFRKGIIQFFGKPPGQANTFIGYMPQAQSISEQTSLSARSLVAAVHQGEHWGIPWPSSARQAAVHRALELAGALSYADRSFSILSGGEKKRVMLAQAVIDEPKMLILDEPLASLDPKNQKHLVDCIANIKKKTAATILFIAHDANPLLGVMDRVMYMAGGKARLGKVDEVISSQSLSELYGIPIHVTKSEGRLFIVNAESNIAEAACCH